MAVPEKIGRYEILEEVGRGAMGAVYKARDPNIGRIVAIKTILSAALTGPLAEEYRKRFQREARAAGMLAHPGIVTVFDVDEQDGTSFLVMEFVQGRTMASALDMGERFPFSSLYDLGSQLADALGYAHAHGVIHRDIKPANILLTAAPGSGPDSLVKIADFGVAKLSTSQITTVQQMLGTPAFMSPEQCTGAPVDGRSDLFSLGVILYWMATGDKPFTGETLTALSYKIVHAEPIAPRALNPGMPAQLERLILKCLAKSAEDRYATAKELALALAALAEPGTLRLRIPDAPEPKSRSLEETTPMLGTPPPMLRTPALEPPAVEPPPVQPAARPPQPEPYRPPAVDNARLSAETVTHRTAPLPPQKQPLPPSPPPPLVPKAPLPPPTPSRAWYDPATRAGSTIAPTEDTSYLAAASEPLPAQVTPSKRNLVPALVGLIGVLVVALLVVVFWPRSEAPAPKQSPNASAPAATSATAPPQPSGAALQPSSTPGPVASDIPANPAAAAPAKAAARLPAGASSIPPPRRATPKRISLGGNIQNDRFISGPLPEYPPLARQARIQDTVRLAAVIGTDGAVTQLNAISGHPLLIQSAVDAVRYWRYDPALVNGEPVEVSTTIDVVFRLNATTDSSPSASAASKTSTQTSPPPSQPSSAAATPPSAAANPPAKPPAASTTPPPAPAASTPPTSATAAPAKSAPSPTTNPAPAAIDPSPTAPTANAPGGPPTLYGESSKASVLILAQGIPQNLELLVFEGDTQLVRRLASARTTTTDFSRELKVLPGQRVFRVVFRRPNSSVEVSKTERARLNVRGAHTLTIEIRGADDNGLPRFNLKVK